MNHVHLFTNNLKVIASLITRDDLVVESMRPAEGIEKTTFSRLRLCQQTKHAVPSGYHITDHFLVVYGVSDLAG